VQEIVYPCFLNAEADASDSAQLESLRAFRLKQVDTLSEVDPRQVRAFPILAALAPAITDVESEVTYPGDPVCLYTALSVMVSRATASAAMPPGPEAPYSDLYPECYRPPGSACRSHVHDSGVRPPAQDRAATSDDLIFDPRVWSESVSQLFEAELRRRGPRVVLISSVSLAHRYALRMARIVKSVDSSCLVVFGGRHVDETVRYDRVTGSVRLEPSSTISVMADGKVPRDVDFLVSGEGPYALDLLMRAIALSMDVQTKTASVADVVRALTLLASEGAVPGRSLVIAVDGSDLHAFPLNGPGYSMLDLPSPYSLFAIRARFAIFTDEAGNSRRTAHMILSNACPFNCVFCSEPSRVVGSMRSPRAGHVGAAVSRVCEYVSYGADSIFFDDSIFWSGNWALIKDFCQLLDEVRSDVTSPLAKPWIVRREDARRLRDLEWGAQFTAETLLRPERDVDIALALMRAAGCTYAYMGIESLSEEVMAGIHKNLRGGQGATWQDKVRQALLRLSAAGIRAGSAVLFGLDNETPETIEETIEKVGLLIDEGLLMLASPNILTYHPGAAITHTHGMEGKIDYHSTDITSCPPYSYFEEAFPGVTSRCLTEQDIWSIHDETEKRWGTTRNSERGAIAIDFPIAAGRPVRG
jgi:radical SAM superfamily enzyme YgiQ (UPF0313 family)